MKAVSEGQVEGRSKQQSGGGIIQLGQQVKGS